VDAVQGIRGGYWQGRDKRGLRKSYRTGAHRDGAVVVSDQFFDLLRDETCGEWLDHLTEQQDPVRHVRELPAWIRSLLKSVDFNRPVGRDAAAHVAAAVLDVSVRSVYRRVRE
jgi:hypothetical protein